MSDPYRPEPQSESAYPPPAAPPYAQAAPQNSGMPYGSAPAPQSYGAPYGAAPGYGGYSGARTNSLAIISFIASLVGMFVIPFLASVAAVITGHMSLGQIKRTGEGGRGLALAGTIIGWVGVAFSVLGLILLLSLWPLFVTSLSTSGI